jgi:subfamily B ATP-binding cassette protein MsbA
VVKALTPLVRRHALAVTGLVALGSATAVTEGIGLGLFVPLFGSLEGPAAAAAPGGPLGTLLDAPFAHLAPEARVRAVLLTLFGLLLARNVLLVAHGALSAALVTRVAHELRSAAFAQVLRVEERWLERRDTGSWLNLLESQTWETAAALGTLVGGITRVCRIAVFGVALLVVSVPLTIAVGLVLGLVSAIVRLLARRADVLGRAETAAWERMAQRFAESLRTHRTIRVFGRERFEMTRLDAVSETERRIFRRLQTVQTFVAPAGEFLVATLMLALLWGHASVPGSLPSVLAFLAILYRLHPQVQQLDGTRVSLAAAAAPVGAVTALLDPAEKPLERLGGAPYAGLRDAIAFRDVTYTYDSRCAPAIDRASFVVRAGRTTAITGPSGSGKSTVVKLLLGLVHPGAGAIEIDGVPLDGIDLASWRARVALVGQDLPLFDATVAENVAYGLPGPVSDDAIRAAAVRADADAFIRALPEGYATRLGDDGARLSGGQRQRIALARALLRDPDVIVLDEATNAVDGVSAGLIDRTLAELGRGRTVVVVSHRAETIRRADDVVVLDAGRVVDAGPRERVLGRGGPAARLFGGERQAGGAR